MSYEKLLQNTISTDSINAWRASGKKALGYVCCHVPEEIFYAANVLPVRLRATGCTDSASAESWMSSFSCSYAKSILEFLMNGTYELDGLVQSDGCLMATRIYDNWEHISKKEGKTQFLHQVGAPRITNDYTVEYYASELQEFADRLGEFSGSKVTPETLKAAIVKANEMRRLIGELYEMRKANEPVVSGEEVLRITLAECDLPIDEYVAALKEFIADAKTRTPIKARARLMVIGSALDNAEYLKVIEEKGGIIVTDSLCYGKKAFGDEMVIDDNNVMLSLSRYYLSRNTCPRSIDNRPEIHKEIVDACKDYNVEGVIYQKMQNCEVWGGESYYLEPDLKAAGIPLLIVEREEHLANVGQLAIRAEAFVEMIEK